MQDEYYAHSLDGKPPKDWQPLEVHLKNVAKMARIFVEAFGAGEWGYLAGMAQIPRDNGGALRIRQNA